MDIRKVKIDYLTILACLLCTLSLVSSFEGEAPKICAKHFDNMYFIKFNSKLNEKKNIWDQEGTVTFVGTGKWFYI